MWCGIDARIPVGVVDTTCPAWLLPDRTSMTAKKSSSASSRSPAKTRRYGDGAAGADGCRGALAQAAHSSVRAIDAIFIRLSVDSGEAVANRVWRQQLEPSVYRR